MRFLTTLLAAAILTATAPLFAQQTVTGSISDIDGEPLAGVNVFIASTYEGTTTDSLGAFSFTASAKTPFTVQTQYIGYRVDSTTVRDAAAEPLRFRLRESAMALSEVVVSAGAFLASDTRKTAVLSSVDVATTGATADLAEALSTLPGSTPAGESGQLMVRGGSPAETQAYINGLRIPNLYTSRLPDVPSRTRFSPFAFKGVTFATGGFSTEYGDALSGALILQTTDMPDKDLTQVSLMSLGGGVTRTQKFGGNQAIALGVEGSHLGLYTALYDEASERITKTPRTLSAQGGYWWQGREGRNLKMFAQTSMQSYAASDSADARFYGTERLALDNHNVYTQVAYQQPQGIDGLWSFGASVAANRDRFGFDANDIALDQLDLQGRASYSDNYRDIMLWRAGVEQAQRRERFEWGDTESLTPVQELRRDYSAAFVESDFFLAGKWVLRAGLRGDVYHGNSAHISPRGQLSYLFSAKHQLALSAGKYVQRQTNEDLFALDHGLRAASLDYYGLTYSRSWKGRVLRAEAYAKTYHDLATLTQQGEFATDGDGYARGFDLFFRDRKTVKNADFWVSYSFIDTERRRGSLTERARVSFAAQQNIAFVAKRYFAKSRMGLSATYRYHNGRPFDNPNSPVRFGETTPDFHDLSLNVTHLTNIKGHFTVIFVSLTNVAGARQVHQYRYSEQPQANGQYDRIEVDNLFPRFPFVGMFVSIGDKNRVGDVDDI